MSHPIERKRNDRRPRNAPSSELPAPGWLMVGSLLLIFALSQYGYGIALPFVNDDYFFIDRARADGLWGAIDPARSLFHWYRPISTGLHFWIVDHVSGGSAAGFHLANLILWLGVQLLYWRIVRTVAGDAVATLATAWSAALAVWAVPILWPSGAQDLLVALFGLSYVALMLEGRPAPALAAFGCALLSKETAIVFPAIATTLEIARGRPRRQAIAARTLEAGVTCLWIALHPTLGARLLGPLRTDTVEVLHRESARATALRSLGTAFNLDQMPRPDHVPLHAILSAVIGATCLAWPVLRMARRRPSFDSPTKVIAVGTAWATIGLLVVLLPSIGWHPYYALLGCMGASIVAAGALKRRIRVAAALLAVLVLLRTARGYTLSTNWGDEAYHRRAGYVLRSLHEDLLAAHPHVAPGTRMYFAGIPDHIGFIAADGPALRVWYDEPSVEGHYFSEYRPRIASRVSGTDAFFRFDQATGRLREISPLKVDGSPTEIQDQELLAATFLEGGDWKRALDTYAALSIVAPRMDYSVLAATLLERTGRTREADSTYRWIAQRMAYPVTAVRESSRAMLNEMMNARSHAER